jgi:hypothetical protein
MKKKQCFVSDYSFLCGPLDQRVAILRRGFHILCLENIQLRSQVVAYRKEAQRLSNMLINFDF